MPTISLETVIHAPQKIVFDLARSIDLHQDSTYLTNEKAIAGRVNGLIEIGETVTWRAKHFGIYQNLTVVITKMDSPSIFVDEMVSGAFKGFVHEHRFEQDGALTIMRDEFVYESPMGILGCFADLIFLKRYMTSFLKERNEVIKQVAESNTWQRYLAKY